MSLQPPEEPARDDAERDARASGKPLGEDAAAATAAEESSPAGTENTGPSTNRIILWVIVGGIALYLIGSGVYGILVK
ncbi:hypothetical protein [Cryobacterium fucosi]|uniref:Uncharacterized protein n=1 Tax=Cryobacterium fucosi TaxID=1259157 RepID=A0A4R9AYB3_9MICO|nr:hypothetical protein [Cryobacterium fucosi]TFD72527.1 hypothetical protein E3T48_15260 [Cryobacterium fucosi]